MFNYNTMITTVHNPYNKFYSVFPMQAPIGSKPDCYIYMPGGKYVCRLKLVGKECLCSYTTQLYKYPADPALKSVDSNKAEVIDVVVTRTSPEGCKTRQRVKHAGKRKYKPTMHRYNPPNMVQPTMLRRPVPLLHQLPSFLVAPSDVKGVPLKFLQEVADDIAYLREKNQRMSMVLQMYNRLPPQGNYALIKTSDSSDTIPAPMDMQVVPESLSLPTTPVVTFTSPEPWFPKPQGLSVESLNDYVFTRMSPQAREFQPTHLNKSC